MSEARYRVRASAVIIRQGKLLLIACDDGSGLHYNIPGGGVNHDETLQEAVAREALEEAGIKVSVGRLLVVHELHGYGNAPEVSHMFECAVDPGDEPSMSNTPDTAQVGIEWVDLLEVDNRPLLPPVGPLIRRALETGACEFAHRHYSTMVLR